MNLQFAICNFSSFYELTYCVSTYQKDKADKKIANCKLQFAIPLTTTCCVSTYCTNIICEKNCKFNQPYKHTLYFVTLHREKFTKRAKPSRRHLETISKEYRTMLSEKISQNNNCRLMGHGFSSEDAAVEVSLADVGHRYGSSKLTMLIFAFCGNLH